MLIRVKDSRGVSGAHNGEGVRGEEERQFLVGVDEEEEGEAEAEGGNVGVQLSRLDVHTSNSNGDASGRAQYDNVSGGGLSAKAGIILVGFPFL